MAAQALALGMDGLEFLETEDRFKAKIMSNLVNRTTEIKQEWNEALANQIANEVAKRIRF